MEFKYQIGEVVASLLHLDELRRCMRKTELSIRPDTMRIEERVSIECIGGTQLFYSCRCRDGSVQKHAQDILVPGEDLWNAWVAGIDEQAQRKAKL